MLRGLPADAALARAPALELLAHAHAVRREAGAAEAASIALRAAADRAGTVPLRARADLAAGRAAAAAGRHERARVLLEDAADGFRDAGAPYERAEARRALAAGLDALGRHADAERERTAAAAAERGAPRRGGAPAAPARAQRRASARCSPCIAGGATNRRVAEQLVLSEHTVHRHVANILRKLDLPSRAAAAAVHAREMARTGDDGGGGAA